MGKWNMHAWVHGACAHAWVGGTGLGTDHACLALGACHEGCSCTKLAMQRRKHELASTALTGQRTASYCCWCLATSLRASATAGSTSHTPGTAAHCSACQAVSTWPGCRRHDTPAGSGCTLRFACMHAWGNAGQGAAVYRTHPFLHPCCLPGKQAYRHVLHVQGSSQTRTMRAGMRAHLRTKGAELTEWPATSTDTTASATSARQHGSLACGPLDHAQPLSCM